MLRALAEGSGGPRELQPVERAGLSWIAKPRVIPHDRGERPGVLLTDGAIEATVTVGAVLFDPVLGRLEFAGAAVPRKVELSWGGSRMSKSPDLRRLLHSRLQRTRGAMCCVVEKCWCSSTTNRQSALW